MSPVYNMVGVKREALAKVLQDEIDRRVHPGELVGYGEGYGFYAAGLAEEIEASGQMTSATAKRRLHAIMVNDGWYTTRSGKRLQQQVVNLDTADKILTALDLNYLWHTNQELADSIVEPPEKTQPAHLAAIRDQKRQVKPCRGCGGDWDVFRSDCRTCQSRRCYRVKRERDKSAAAAAGLGGPRDGHGFTRTGRVSAGGSTTTSIERKAA